MNISKEIIIPIIILTLLILVPGWIIYNYLGDFIFYQKLSTDGVVKKATLENKGVLKDGEFHTSYTTLPSENHQFIVGYKTDDNKYVKCQVGVSQTTYDVISKRDELAVMYLPSDPLKCTLPSSVEINRYTLMSTLMVACLFILLSIGFAYYIYKSFRKPVAGEEIKLTNNLELKGDNLICPRCGDKMTEGYLPTVGGVSWRDMDEPIGIPTVFSGLPGTTHWIRRPMLHAFHCKSCKIITFKYGKN